MQKNVQIGTALEFPKMREEHPQKALVERVLEYKSYCQHNRGTCDQGDPQPTLAWCPPAAAST